MLKKRKKNLILSFNIPKLHNLSMATQQKITLTTENTNNIESIYLRVS